MNEAHLASSRGRHSVPGPPFTRGCLARLGATESNRCGARGGLGRAGEGLNTASPILPVPAMSGPDALRSCI